MKAPKQFNNITQRLVDDLKASLTSKSRLSIAAASFSIYANEALKEELENVDLMPLGMGAVSHANDNVQHSTIFILKNKNNGTSIDKTNLLHPFNIAYISHNGEILCGHLSP